MKNRQPEMENGGGSGKNRPMKGDELSDRFLEFSGRIVRVARSLSNDVVSKHIFMQLLRSGTSAGANYEEARAAESRADFTHKLRVALKELREFYYWLRLIAHTAMLPASRMNELIAESDQLSRILAQSIVTVKGNAEKPKNKK